MTIYATYENSDGETISVTIELTDFDTFVHAGPDARVFVCECMDQYTVRKGDLTFSLTDD